MVIILNGIMNSFVDQCTDHFFIVYNVACIVVPLIILMVKKRLPAIITIWLSPLMDLLIFLFGGWIGSFLMATLFSIVIPALILLRKGNPLLLSMTEVMIWREIISYQRRKINV